MPVTAPPGQVPPPRRPGGRARSRLFLLDLVQRSAFAAAVTLIALAAAVCRLQLPHDAWVRVDGMADRSTIVHGLVAAEPDVTAVAEDLRWSGVLCWRPGYGCACLPLPRFESDGEFDPRRESCELARTWREPLRSALDLLAGYTDAPVFVAVYRGTGEWRRDGDAYWFRVRAADLGGNRLVRRRELRELSEQLEDAKREQRELEARNDALRRALDDI